MVTGGCDVTGEWWMVTGSCDCSDDNKGVSSEGPSITSIPKEGSSITRRSKEPIPKELLKWYGYDTVEDYLPIAKKLIPKVIFKIPIPIKGCVLGLASVETWDNIVKKFRIRTPERSDDHDLLVNSDNENDDMLGYESEKYSDDEDAYGTNHAEDADGTNHSDLKLVNKGITRLYKFHREYGKPGGIKIKVTFDALNKVSGLNRALFLSLLGDLVREHIGLKILSWKKRYINVDLTVRKLIENKEIEADGEPLRGIMWLKGRVNKDEEFTDDDIRSVGDKLKEANEKIKEGTLNLDDDTDAMTVMLRKEKGDYARGVGSGVTYKRYFHLPRSRQATDERSELLQT
nr:hypothetical protein [Tanacetum cinerariifolium]